MKSTNMYNNKIKIDVEAIDKMVNNAKQNRVLSDVSPYNENIEMDVSQLVSDGYEVFMEYKGDDVYKWDVVHVKFFELDTVFQEFKSSIEHCINNATSTMETKLSYYGFGLDMPVVVVFSSNQNDKKAIELLGPDEFSIMLSRTMLQEMVNKIIELAKDCVNVKTLNKTSTK